MNKKILGIGTGVAALAVAGAFGYRHFTNTGPAPAAASTPDASRVITLGTETPPPVAPGRVVIAPVTPKQMPPKAEPKPAATQPAPQPAVTKAPAAPAPKAAPTITPVQPKPAAPKSAVQKSPAPRKSRVISLSGDPQAAAGDAASSSNLTAREKVSLALLKQLQHLRGGIGTWRAQHGGALPNFAENPMWEQFLRDPSGRLAGSPPVNPLNGHSRVLPVAADPAPAEAVGGPIGYVYAVRSGKLYATDAMGRVFDETAVDAVALEAKAAREMPLKDQERYVLNALDAVRSQVVKYASQHFGRPPDFARFPAFEQLMQPTLGDGRLAEGQQSGQVFGPYLLSSPINPFTGRHKVAVVPGELRPGQRIDRSDVGFVYSAATNRFFALDSAGLVYDDAKVRAGYVAPEAGGTGAAAARGAAADDSAVDVLRNFIAHYQRQHNGAVPNFKRYPRWEQLTGKTRADGKPDPAGMFGPYLFKTPVNLKNNSSDVDVVARVKKGYKPKKPSGYVVDTSSGTIYLTDEFGVIIIDG